MPEFVLICRDKPGMGDLRANTRPDHLAFMDASGGAVRLAGPLNDDAGAVIGSLIVVEVEDAAAAQAFADADPYHQAGLFQSVEIRGFRTVRPSS